MLLYINVNAVASDFNSFEESNCAFVNDISLVTRDVRDITSNGNSLPFLLRYGNNVMSADALHNRKKLVKAVVALSGNVKY